MTPLSHQQDLQLIRKVLAGDSAAAEDLADRLQCVHRLVRSGNRRLGGRVPAGDLDDVIQNALAAIWSKIHVYNGTAPLEAWVAGFCRKETLKMLDARRRPDNAALTASDVAELHQPAALTAEQLLGLNRVEEEVRRLEPILAHIVHLKYFEDLTFAEISRATDLPLGTVKTFYYRAVERLRSRLSPLWRAMVE